ncbi:MAG TPA: MDR family MFS transporter [Archangium sp.]|nr:MDR family MFS transporter [Archangium sp.]
MLSTGLVAIDATVIATAVPSIVQTLGGFAEFPWLFSVYLLAQAVTVPVYGKLADVFGRKPVMLFGIGLFLAGSVLSGLSTSMNMLIAFRTLQGLGAGAMQPVSLTIIGDIYTLEQRAKVQGVFSGVWGLAGLVGPLTGGLIVKYLTWHWVFFINVPVGLGAFALLVFFFHEQVQHKPQKLDYVGAVLLSAGVVALLFGVQGIGRNLLGLPVGAVLLAAFVWVERRVASPIIPMSIFKNPAITISAVAGALFSAAMFGATTYVPLYVQGVLGGSPTLAGGMITPMIVGWPVASLFAGRLLLKTGFRPLIVGGLGLTVIGTGAMALLLKPESSLLIPELGMALFGIGLGFTATSLLIAVQTSVGWELRGVATASHMFFRTVGGALGVGLMGGVVVSQLLKDPSVPLAAANELLGPEHGRGLSPAVFQTLSGALGTGLTINFWIICAATVGAFAAGLFFPKVKRGEGVTVSSTDVAAPH